MNPLLIVASALVLISIIGIFKRHREIFLTGYFLYGLLVFFAETNEYLSSGENLSLFVAFLWLIQAILSFPMKAKYDSITVKKDRIKTCLSLSLINLTGVLVPDISPAPDVTFYIHLIMTILPLLVVFLYASGRIEMEKN
tara:strand:- start:576 stop:995 length:420 start_codon:yes stop_codon:yes gene_type:complete